MNLKGVWLGIKHAVTQMLAQGQGGSIVNTASLSALVGIEHQGGYGSAKGGVAQLTRVAAVEYATDGIRCNSICPGGILTPLLYRDFGSADLIVQQTEAALAACVPDAAISASRTRPASNAAPKASARGVCSDPD